MNRWVEGKIIEHKAWNPILFSLYVEAPIESFMAGQFTQIGVKVQEKILFRPYSFVNPPTDHCLEFFYNIVPEGELTPLLVPLKAGDSIWVGRKPSGRFMIDNVGQGKHLWLLSTGTGSSPFLSLLRTEEVWKRFSKVIWAHSVRVAIDLTHQAIIENITRDHPDQFQFIPIITREKTANALHQRLPVLMEAGSLETHANAQLSTSNSQVMLCGNPAMIQDVIAVLEAKHFVVSHPKKMGNITIENYWKLHDHE